MRVNLKILKGIFFFLMALIMAGTLGILVCALTPSLTAMLAQRVENMNPAGFPQSSQQPDGMGGLLQEGTGQEEGIPDNESNPGINADWLDGRDSYEIPGEQSLEMPDSISGKGGYEPVREEAEQIDEEEADDLPETDSGDTGSGLTFEEEIYPYYAMLEPDMQQIYCQIYANALNLNKSFAPVVPVSVSQLKTVFEAVYNDHPELFWLDTGYSCKYVRSGRCAEITLKYNETVDNLEEAKAAFEGAAGHIAGEAQGLGSVYEMEQYVHDALMQLVEYDLGAPMNQSAYSALVGGRSVCAGYARAFQYIMQLLGVPCYYCTGYAGEDHAWNIVKLDGMYRNVDITWDDTDSPTYDYFNKSDKEFAPTHVRTGLSLYLPACGDSAGVQEEAGSPEGAADGGGSEGEGGPAEDTGGAEAGEVELINPNPVEPLVWQSKVKPEAMDAEEAEAERQRENLERAGITEEQVRDTMEEYYQDCGKLLKEAGTGYGQFINVIPKDLWSAVERSYNSGAYWDGYVGPALKEMGAEGFSIQLQAQNLGGGYYRLYHNVYTY